jgi:hypothetical protein
MKGGEKKILENFVLSSLPIEVSDFPNHKEATFLISVLDEYNANNVLIQAEEGEKYHSTIVGYPILAYLKYDKEGKPDDFGGHELRTKYNTETKKVEYYFATHPIGSVIESWIEEREVDGYEGKKKTILIKTKLWKSRFPEYFKVFDKLWDKGRISSSWEISSSEAEKTARGKILKAFEFIGNALLGSSVIGAVHGAGVLEVAENDEMNYELSNAFLNDVKSENISTLPDSDTSENDKVDINKYNINSNEGGKDLKKEDQNEVSALTDNDLYRKVRKALNSLNEDKYFYVSMLYPYEFKVVAYTWERSSEEDFITFTYTVNSDDTISIVSQTDVKMKFIPVTEINSQISELQSKLAEANKEIAEAGKLLIEATKEKEVLEAEVEKLTPFKEKVDEMEQAEKVRILTEKKEELKTFTLEDSLISEEELESDEKLVSIFAELTIENFESAQEKIEVIKGKRAIEKYKASKSENKDELDTSEVKNEKKPKTDLNNSDSDSIMFSAADIIKGLIAKK